MANARTGMSDFLEYNKTSAINSFNAHRGIRGTAILSGVDYLFTLQSNASAQNLKKAPAKYNNKCNNMEIAVERLVCINQANSDKYLKVLEDINKEKEALNKHVTKVYKSHDRSRQKI